MLVIMLVGLTSESRLINAMSIVYGPLQERQKTQNQSNAMQLLRSCI